MAPEGEFAEAIPSAGQVKTWRSIQNPYGIHNSHKYTIVFTSIHKSYESHMSFEGILSFRPAPVPFRVVKARGSACSQFGKHPKFLVYMSPQSTSGNAICDRLYIYISSIAWWLAQRSGILGPSLLAENFDDIKYAVIDWDAPTAAHQLHTNQVFLGWLAI